MQATQRGGNIAGKRAEELRKVIKKDRDIPVF